MEIEIEREPMDLETDKTLSAKLKIFKSTNFDPHSYVTDQCGATTEKEIKQICMHLVTLKKASAEEMRKSVYANYPSFIRTSREISDLEAELVSLKNLLSARANLVHGIADGVRVESLPDETRDEDTLDSQNKELIKYHKWLSQFMEKIDVLLAERRVDEALAALDEGEAQIDQAKAGRSLTPSALLLLQSSVMESRRKLGDQIAEATCQASTNGFVLRSSLQAMKKLGDGPRAHALLLKSHQQKLYRNTQSLQPWSSSAYSTALSRLVFSTIGQAANDSLTIFDDEPAFSSELVTWAVNQTLSFAQVIKKNVIAAPAASGCLRIVAESAHICLGHCSLLEDRGLVLCPTLLKFFRPYLEQALTTNLKRIDLSTAAIAASDDWSLLYSPISVGRLSSSAHRLNTMIQELCEDIGSLEMMHLSEQALEGVVQSFNSYVTMMIHALPTSENMESSGRRRIVKMAETEIQQIALLANAVQLADELLPRAAMKLFLSSVNTSDDQSQRQLKKRFQRTVDQLRDRFCLQHALDLIFTEDEGVRLSAEMYISIDESTSDPEWFPSPIYQELFAKLTRIGSIVSDIFVGRERFATLLLTRLTEAVILCFSDDPNFWQEMEAGPRRLGPLGLQQFYLDMKFVILFASQGRFASTD